DDCTHYAPFRLVRSTSTMHRESNTYTWIGTPLIAMSRESNLTARAVKLELELELRGTQE
ncbi:unnamed protein product, partial [Ilex paraguariensis]